MKIYLEPYATINDAEGGINTVVRNHVKLYPKYDIEVVTDPDQAHLHVVHAGMGQTFYKHLPLVSHLHGVYWTADYEASQWEWEANAHVFDTIKRAKRITVPSPWVAKSFQRDMRLSPTILPHGINWWEWQHDYPTDGYVLWNKNRGSDVCDPNPVRELALRAKRRNFMTTIAPQNSPGNVHEAGIMPHYLMKETVQRAGVYLATTKETFGVGILEAMASGVPVLGFKWGNVTTLVEHGVNGYLASPYDYDDLLEGLDYCFRYRERLGQNGIILSKQYTWDHTMEVIRHTYEQALKTEEPSVSVVIPCYNYGDKVNRAVQSVLKQSYLPKEIIIVDNNSTKSFSAINKTHPDKLRGDGIISDGVRIRLINEAEQGVAHARNTGVRNTSSTYVCCLDADDEIAPHFLRACISELEKDHTLGVAYTRLHWINDVDGSEGDSDWPGEYDFDPFMRGQNQVPTCCVFRREAFDRLGGFRQRYAPDGAGAEDAEFYLRMGAIGYGGKLATNEYLFKYHVGEGYVSGNPDHINLFAYRAEPEFRWHPWVRNWHPWILDLKHPFLSNAKPQNFSHPVRQYDTPLVSVIIPVGKGHEKYLVDALDSLEAQTMRQWEVILVYDGHKPSTSFLQAYPYAKIVQNPKRKGTGHARNQGVKQARSTLLLFLDADDWLEPKALERMYDTYMQSNRIVYTDYIGHAIVDREEAERLFNDGKLLLYRQKQQRASIIHTSMEFDCARAMAQPELDSQGQFYIWNLVSSLVPKAQHDKIGGFDETMKSWEDWDYYLRHARYGHCFIRLPEMLVHYRFDTGTRREIGKVLNESLIQYMRDKYRRLGTMASGCGGCSGSGGQAAPQAAPEPMFGARSMNVGIVPGMGGQDMVYVKLVDGSISDHRIVVEGTEYGYRTGGDVFLMVLEHAKKYPNRFQVIAIEEPQAQVETPKPVTAPPPELVDNTPAPVIEDDETPEVTFDDLTGLSAAQIQALSNAFGTIQDLAIASIDSVMEVKGFGEARSRNVIAQANKLIGG